MLEQEWSFLQTEPARFFAQAERLAKQVGASRFFREPGISWLREAWTIGRFGQLAGAHSVALCRTDPPDALLWTMERQYSVEITEALPPGRRRADEYKPPIPPLRVVPDNHYVVETATVQRWLGTAIDKKLMRTAKNRRFDLLLVHLSGWNWMEEPRLRTTLRESVERYQRSGHNICVLFGKRAAGPPSVVRDGYKSDEEKRSGLGDNDENQGGPDKF